MGFKPGDKIICVNRENQRSITDGNIYEVVDPNLFTRPEELSLIGQVSGNDNFVFFIDDEGRLNTKYTYRFEDYTKQWIFQTEMDEIINEKN